MIGILIAGGIGYLAYRRSDDKTIGIITAAACYLALILMSAR